MECFALLDDASAADTRAARSRLYTRHVDTLTCARIEDWPALLAALQAAEIDAGATLLVLSADHMIRDITAFHAAVKIAIAAADKGHMATFG
ncbi:MAG: hypothetical protein ACLGI6_01370, partial [Gammaproteobacteria bacterium]